MFKKVQLPFYLFYVGGFVYTAFIVSSNLEEYFAHKSNDVHMELDETNETCSQVINDINKESYWFKPNTVRLPNIVICTDSMHSKLKVAKKYPLINKTMIQGLYGFNIKGLKKSMWEIRDSLPHIFKSLRRDFDREYMYLNSINLTKFYKDTSPVEGLNSWF